MRRPKPPSLVLVLVLVSLAVATGCDDTRPGTTTGAPSPSDLPERVVVLSPDDGPEGADWTPSVDDVEAAESLLTEVVAPMPGAEQLLQPLNEYVRQYAGVDGDVVAVNGLCDYSLGWEESWVVVDDGGTCFWHAEVAGGEVTAFSVNGRG